MKRSSGQDYGREKRSHDIILDLNPRPDSFSNANRRSASTMVQRFYPWLLTASTAIAAAFCFAYITKPVLVTQSPGIEPTSEANPITPISNTSIPKPVATSKRLPGEKPKNHTAASKRETPPAPVTSGFEETNIRMQHILDAKSTSGDIHRIVIDVPALYKSRNLRWSQDDAAQARLLLRRLEDYQEKSRALRDEGAIILGDWNSLMDASVPNHVLRADSPSISTNLSKTSRLAQEPDSGAVKIQRDKESP